jgi:N-methylhydantoinase A
VWAVGVDVGGTFTDVVSVNTDTHDVHVAKVPTSLPDQSDGFIAGLEAAGVDIEKVDIIVHGTTTGTNAVLERKTAKVGLITTAGFRDTLELGRRTRPTHFGLRGSFDPLVPRHLRLEVSERFSAQGEELLPLDLDGVRRAVATLREAGCESLAISFLHSYVDASHEEAAAEVARQAWPNPYVSTGAGVLPEIREFERTTAAVLNAALRPLIARYVKTLQARLRDRGYRGELLLVQANGGVMSADVATEEAIRTVLSGPAAGATAAGEIAVRAGFPNVISADMGGTSFDLAMIRDGKPALTMAKELDFKVPLRIPSADIVTIGQGGGSIAYVDRSGLLKVGPESAGSVPGPIVYGRGGERVTITDANVWLGRLDVSRFAGSETDDLLPVLERSLLEQLAEPLGISVDEAAAAVLRVANDAMAGATRLVLTERGADPREFAMLAFGGAGPLHAVEVATGLGIPHVVFPLRPGVTSALGCVVADYLWTNARSMPRTLAALSIDELRDGLRDLESRGLSELNREGVEHEGISVTYAFDLQYEGQFHVFELSRPDMPTSVDALAAAFEEEYAARFGGALPRTPIRLVTIRAQVVGKRPALEFASLNDRGEVEASPEVVSRRVWVDDGWQSVQVIDRLGLASGDEVAGPAVLEQPDSTLLLDGSCKAVVDDVGNLIVAIG